MSKFFNETQKAQWNSKTSSATSVDVGTLVEVIKKEGHLPLDIKPQSSGDRRQIGVPEHVAVVKAGAKYGDYYAASANEAYRTLRTRLMRVQNAKNLRSVMITSSLPGEGKTLTSLNLALSCGQLQNVRTLLIDGDLRSRGLSRLLDLPADSGLCDVLSGTVTPEDAICRTEQQNLFVIGAGSPITSPPELFAGPLWLELIDWANSSFDVVLVDAPPIHSVTDAELIHAACDGALMVIRAHATDRELAQKCAAKLDKKKLVGVVFNDVAHGSDGGYGGYAVGELGVPGAKR